MSTWNQGEEKRPSPNLGDFAMVMKGHADNESKLNYLMRCLRLKEYEIEDLRLQLRTKEHELAIAEKELASQADAFVKSFDTLRSLRVLESFKNHPVEPSRKGGFWSFFRRKIDRF